MGRLFFYGIAALMGLSGGLPGILVMLGLVGLADWFINRPSDQKVENLYSRPLHPLIGKPLGFVGILFGFAFLGSIAFGLLAAILSPTSCSTSSDTEYRAR
jgi:hypothetical protein